MKQNKKDQPISTNRGDLKNTDLQDSERDKERLKPDEATIDLPDVKDIPGQEFIHPPNIGKFADTTISSDDEEGVGIFEDSEDDKDIQMNTEADIPKEDKSLLQQTDERMPTDDEDRLRRSSLDNTDNEGDPLNERSMDSARTGSDLDTSGVDEDDRNEFIGEEDEENNTYSLGGDENEADENNGTAGIP
jgi:hypothetical protein